MIMGRQGDSTAIQDHMIKYELVEGLQRAIDYVTAETSAKAPARADYLPKRLRPRTRQMRLRLSYSRSRMAK